MCRATEGADRPASREDTTRSASMRRDGVDDIASERRRTPVLLDYCRSATRQGDSRGDRRRVAAGCREAGCAVARARDVGEHPGSWSPASLDLSGAVGAADRAAVLPEAAHRRRDRRHEQPGIALPKGLQMRARALRSRRTVARRARPADGAPPLHRRRGASGRAVIYRARACSASRRPSRCTRSRTSPVVVSAGNRAPSFPKTARVRGRRGTWLSSASSPRCRPRARSTK